MKKIILILVSFCFMSSVFSQNQIQTKTKILTVDEVENQKSKKFDNSETKNFTTEDLQNIDNLINKKDFSSLYEYLRVSKVSSKNYINLLESKRDLGIIPLYWLMADYYSFQSNAVEATHFWESVAVITTSQDAELCNDMTSKYAAQKMLKSFPNSGSVIAKTPQYVQTVMPKVKFFISNLKTRISPDWVCVFGDKYYSYKNDPLIPKDGWQQKREEVFNKFTSNFAN